MEMQQIRYFLSLAENLNFTRAAETCNVSQPALTRAIQALEAELGGDLIRREGRNTHLTELGRRMLPLMQRCYESAMTARDLARAVTKNEVAPLSLGLAQSVNLETFLSSISELFRGFPGLQLRIFHASCDSVLKRLIEGEFDLAIAGATDSASERLDRWPLFTEGFDVQVHMDHSLSRMNAIEIEDLKKEPLFALAGCENRSSVTNWFDERGAPLNVAHEFDSHHDLNALLQPDAGAAIVPESAPAPSRLRRAKLKGFTLTRTVYVYAPAGRLRSPPSTALLNLLRSADFSVAAA